MTNFKKEAVRTLSNLLGSVNNLITAIMDEEEDGIKYWNDSIKTWKNLTDKHIARVLKEMEKEEENILKEEK